MSHVTKCVQKKKKTHASDSHLSVFLPGGQKDEQSILHDEGFRNNKGEILVANKQENYIYRVANYVTSKKTRKDGNN